MVDLGPRTVPVRHPAATLVEGQTGATLTGAGIVDLDLGMSTHRLHLESGMWAAVSSSSR